MVRVLRSLALLALLVASFARLPAAEAATPVHPPAPQATMAHCIDMPAPTPEAPAKMSIDCMIACAAVTPPVAAVLPSAVPQAAMIEATPPAHLIGIHSAADPPPPRTR